MADRGDQAQALQAASSRVAQRLRAHARLCRHIALATQNEEVSAKLATLADDCVRTAERVEPVGPSTPRRFLH